MSGQPDVWWDWHASDAAIAALRRVAAAVDAEQRQRSRAATELLADWRGPRQDEWALRQAALQITAVQLRDRCLQAAQQLPRLVNEHVLNKLGSTVNERHYNR